MRNEESIFGQIESDIIEKTFDRSEYVSQFIQNVCLNTQRPRILKAKMFLIYAMQHASMLQHSFAVLKEEGFLNFDVETCKGCRNKGKAFFNVAGRLHLKFDENIYLVNMVSLKLLKVHGNYNF